MSIEEFIQKVQEVRTEGGEGHEFFIVYKRNDLESTNIFNFLGKRILELDSEDIEHLYNKYKEIDEKPTTQQKEADNLEEEIKTILQVLKDMRDDGEEL